MSENIKYLLYILKCIVCEENLSKAAKKIDWETIFAAAGAGEVLTILYKKVQELPLEQQPDTEKMDWLKKLSIQIGIRKLQSYDLLEQVLQEAKKQKIKLMILKGPILSALYPEPLLRNSCDIDLYVEEENHTDMENLLDKMHFKKNLKHSKKTVPVYEYNSILTLEVHYRLYEEYAGERVECLESMDLPEEESRVTVNVCGVVMETLGYEQHLIFLIFHLAKHISYNGCTLKNMLDIVLYINAYEKKIDKQDFWEKIEALKYTTFCRILFCIGCYYFGMTKNIFLGEGYSEEIARTMLQQFYDTGILKTNLEEWEKERRASSIVFQSISIGQNKKISKRKIWLKTLFPSSRDLSFRYMYARRYPIFIWIAWIHRAIHQCNLYFVRHNKAFSVAMDVKRAKQKITFLKELDLVQKE